MIPFAWWGGARRREKSARLPTGPQLDYVRALGGDPSRINSRQEATREIDRLKSEGRRAKVEIDEHGQPPSAVLARMRSERDIQQMLGIAQGILMDGVVDDAEVEHLTRWCEKHPDAVSGWPGNHIYRRLRLIMEDGIVDDIERADLSAILKGLVGGTLGLHDESTPASLPLDDPVPEVFLKDGHFVFSGKFAFGPRTVCASETIAAGGRCHNNIVVKTDYLVLGTFGSRDWKFGSFGRKIEKAVDYRERRGRPAIITEDHWASCL